jgi:hypothetical protein
LLAAAGRIDNPADRTNRLKGSIQATMLLRQSAASNPAINRKYFVVCHFL